MSARASASRPQSLRRHVVPAADHGAGASQPGFIGAAGDAEINQVREIVFVKQDLGRFDVAVHQADPVRGLQRFGHLLDDPHRPPRL